MSYPPAAMTLAICEHPESKRRTVYRGSHGCVEECEVCGFGFGYDSDGEMTPSTRAALAKARGQ